MTDPLDRFEVGDELGRGAMGVVYRAVHRDSGIPVALKTMRPTDERQAVSLERELHALARLSHGSILDLYDHGVVGRAEGPIPEGSAWMALELASGGTVEDAPPGDWDACRELALTVLDALSHAHARRLIHRDLKPGNLVVCGPGDLRPGVKLADFGLAWAVGRDRTYKRAGTPMYMAPEQIQGDASAFGPRTDLYALGCVLWEWIAGRAPFARDTTEACLYALLHDPLPAFEPRFDVPDAVEGLLTALVARDPADRPASAAWVLARLRGTGAARTGPLPVPRAWAGPEPTPSAHLLGGAGIGLFALRDHAVVGRVGVRDRMWACLREVVDTGTPRVVALLGAPGAGTSRIARWIGERASELGAVARVWSSDADGPVDPEQTLGILRAACAHGPVIAVLDGGLDHPDGVELASRALHEPDVPLLIVATGGEEPAAMQDLAYLDGVVPIPVRPMPDPELVELIRMQLGVEPGVATSVAVGARGSPGVAVASVRAGLASGALVPGSRGLAPPSGVWREPPVPRDAARAARLGAVLDTLPPDERVSAGLGALLGMEVDGEEWAALARECGVRARDRTLRELSRHGFLTRTPSGWRIADPAVRDVLVGALTSHADLRGAHEAAARVLARREPTAERLERQGDHRVAAGHRDGLERWMDALEAWRPTRRWARVRAIVERLAAHDDGTDPRVTLAIRFYGTVALANVESSRAARHELDALVELLPTLDLPWQQRVHRLALSVYAHAGDPDAALRHLDGADASTLVTRRMRAMLDLEAGRVADAEQQLLAMWADAAEPLDRARAANGLGRAACARGDLDAARGWFQATAALEVAESAHVGLVNVAMVELADGRFDEARRWALRAWDAARLEPVRSRGIVAIALVMAALGARDDALFRRAVPFAMFHALRASPDDVELLDRSLAVLGDLPLTPAERTALEQLVTRLKAASPGRS